MHATFSSHITGNFIVYSTGLLVAVLLLVLTLRAGRLPGTPLANIAFALCGVLWTAGGLAYTATLAVGHPSGMARAVQFTGAIAAPLPVLLVWRPRGRLIPVCAVATATTLIAFLWWGGVAFSTLKTATAFYAAIFLSLGFAACLRPSTAPRAIYLPSLTIVAAGWSAVMLTTVSLGGGLMFGLSHLVMLAVLCGFFLFARFRYADVFVRYSVRILLAGTLAGSLIVTVQSNFLPTWPSAPMRPAPCIFLP